MRKNIIKNMNKISPILIAIFLVFSFVPLSFGLDDNQRLIEKLVKKDTHEYDEVVAAYKQLKSGDKTTFITLLKSVNDSRESYSYFMPQKIYPERYTISVGEVCYDIVLYYLEGETPKIVVSFGSYPKTEVMDFIGKNKDYNLKEIQIKAAEYIINKLKTENKKEFIPYWQNRLEKLGNKLTTN